MVDRHSGFPFVTELRSLTTTSVTRKLHTWFLDFGRPAVIISDGGPQFRQEFAEFCAKLGVKHIQSSPYNSQSNGLAESAVKQVKYLLIKHDGNFTKMLESLTAWRLMPRSKFQWISQPGRTFPEAKTSWGHPCTYFGFNTMCGATDGCVAAASAWRSCSGSASD